LRCDDEILGTALDFLKDYRPPATVTSLWRQGS